MKKKLLFFGAALLLTTIGLNLQFAFANYDFGKNGIQNDILVCTTTLPAGDPNAPEKPVGYSRVTGSCVWSGTSAANAEISLGVITIKANSKGEWSYVAHDAEVRCVISTGGGELCIPQNCPSAPGQ